MSVYRKNPMWLGSFNESAKPLEVNLEEIKAIAGLIQPPRCFRCARTSEQAAMALCESCAMPLYGAMMKSEQRAERYAAKLRELGVDPESV